MVTVNIMNDTYESDVLFIFTDGSYHHYNHIGAAMAALYTGDIIKDSVPVMKNCIRLSNLSSSNEAELYAIIVGLDLLGRYVRTYKNVKRVYLLSDNICAIDGLRDWIYRWIYNKNGGGYNGITNSSLYTEIIMIMNEIGYPISFNHIKGHSYKKHAKRNSDYRDTLNKFNYNNGYNFGYQYLGEVAAFSKCNHIVDTMPDVGYRHKCAINPIHFKPKNESVYETLAEYEQLQGGHLHGFDEEIW